MRTLTNRIIGLVLALAMIAAFVLVPMPMNIKAQAATVPSTNLATYIQDGSTLHCWNWSIANVKANLGLIANMGYSAIQLSPMQELKEGTVNRPYDNWWAVYQPISFNINNSQSHCVGTKSELIDLCQEAHKYNIKVIMDVVFNHTANNGANQLCPLVDPDFLNDPACWHDYSQNSSSYMDRYDVTQKCMAGLPDLNTGNQKVQDKALALMKEYIDCGVDGFRFDAAKQIETPEDHYSYASDFWPTVIDGSNSYAQSTRGITLHFYGELLENTDQGNGGQGTLPMSAYTKYMSVTESVWSNDVRYRLEDHNASGLRKAYFKAANADKMVLWAESHDTVGDGSSLWSNEYNLNKAWALVSSRAYTMALYFPRCLNITDLPLDEDNPNAKPVIQEMGEIVKMGWSSDFTRAVNLFHNHFIGQSEYLTQDTSANLYYNERGNSGVMIVNFNDGGRDINLPVYAMANGTYYDQLTGNQFTVSGGRIYGTMGDTGVAVVYNPSTKSCSHGSHGIDGYCYSCYTYVGHKSGTKCSVCGTASSRTIYFRNTANWSTPYVYGWHDSSSAAVTGGWPGTKMTLVEGNLYKATIPATATNIIFNNNSGSQTANLVPSADNDTFEYETGYWSTQGQVDLADNYYLFYTTNTGAYNGYDHRFVDNKVTVSFSEPSYVWITDSNGVQYMTDGWQGEVTATTLKPLDSISGTPDKLVVPSGTNVNFTMAANSDGTISLSYTTSGSTGGSTGGNTGSTRTIYFDSSSRGWSNVNVYAWNDATGTCTGEWPGSAMSAMGSNIYSYEVPTAATKVIFNNGSAQTADIVIPTDGRNLYNGYSWSTYGSSEPVDIDYYLFGYINGANYGCEEDYANLGEYQFVNGQVTVHFDVDSYVGVKTSTGEWYMTQAYEDSDYGTFYNTSTGASEKMLIPGGTDVLITLIEHSDGTISLMYSAEDCVHSYSEQITTAPTCTAEGMKTYTCTKCGHEYYVVMGATGHSYTSTVTTAATCTTEGVKTFTCSACGNKYTEIIPATGHSYSNGKCTVCGTADADCSHSYTSKVTIAATCISMGTRTYTCTKCGDVYTENIPATGHNYVDIVVPPTCEMNGYTKHQCSFCGAWGLNSDPVNPTGHKFDATGTCTACGYYNENYALKYYLFGWINGADYGCEGDWTNMGQYQFVNGQLTVHFDSASYVGVKTTNNEKWYMVKAYTEETSATFYTTEEGGCDKMYIPGNVDVTMTLTENADGTLTLSYVAGSCDHLFSSYVSTQPGCTTEGVRTHTCGYCGYSYNESIPATGHSYTNGSCSICGAADPSYTSPDYYLFGYINGADYGWKDDESNLGYYKFTDGQLTVRFDEDSYVGVKTGDNAHFYMTNGYMGESPSAILIEFADPYSVAANRLYVPGGKPVTLYLTENSDGSLLLRYTLPPSACTHVMHGTDGVCSACGTLVGHNYADGVCSICGSVDESYEGYDYYLFGYINGANYGCEEDYANLGEYLFVDGKLTATFDTYSYIGIKKVNPNAKYGAEVVGWYMTEAYTENTSAIFKNTNTGTSEKMYVPGGVPVNFTLTKNEDGSLSLSYTTGSSSCAHSYTGKVTTPVGCSNNGVMTYTCSKCGDSYNETIPATGHDFVGGVCSYCGVMDENTTLKETYYLVGWINGADYGCESDYENNGIYKFVNGQLSAKFTQDSYVFVKTENNGKWLLADAYTETPICTFKVGGTEKLFVPGGVQLIFNIAENADGSVVVSYSESALSGCDHTYTAEVTTAATCTTTGVRTYTCSKCSHRYTQTIAATGHNFFGNTCTVCGVTDSSTPSTGNTYYLVGYINGADYGCEGDYQNMGIYKFVNNRLTAKFTQDSYVFLKTEGNGKWLMAGSYCEASTCTFAEGGVEKMFVPGGVELTFTLAENTDGSVTVVYTSGTTPASKVPTLTLKAPTLEFKDMITINAFYTAENMDDVVEMGMITYTSKVSRWSVRSADHVIPGYSYIASSGRYYSASQGIHAKYLADTFYLAVYAKLADGSYVYSKLAPYSPVTYANSQLVNSTNAALKQLVVAMLNYGAQAQLFFGHNTGNLANNSLTAAQLALPAAYSSSMVSAVPAASATKQGSFANNSGFSKRYPAISFEGAFCINYFFTPAYAPVSGITLYYWDAEDYAAASVLSTSNATGSLKMTGSGTGEYRGDLTGISARDLSEPVYVAAVYKDASGNTWTSGVLGYSIGSYCSSQASSGTAIAELAKATAVYGYHAKQYFN